MKATKAKARLRGRAREAAVCAIGAAMLAWDVARELGRAALSGRARAK